MSSSSTVAAAAVTVVVASAWLSSSSISLNDTYGHFVAFRREQNALDMFHGDKAHHVHTTRVLLSFFSSFSSAQIIEKRRFAITVMIKNDLTHPKSSVATDFDAINHD